MIERPREPTTAGLYLHIPFCSSLCPYCDFAVRKGNESVRAEFVETLLAEIALQEPWEIDTVYFGGGTPSSLTDSQLERILEAIANRFSLDAEPWIAMEVNPEDVNRERASVWHRIGVRFLSLGVQSFDDEELKFLGRVHRRARALESVEVALDGDFDTVSVDLIYGLPDQTLRSWESNLETVVKMRAPHVSCYQLTVSPETAFGRKRSQGRLRELSDDGQGALFDLTHGYLGEGGCPAYEVSNFARETRHRSRHNQKYWNHTPYLGLGPSAHSFDGARRWWNHRTTGPYEDAVRKGQPPIAGEEVLSARDLALEALMLGLRTTDGVDVDGFRLQYGIDLAALNSERLARWVSRKHVTFDQRRLQPTRDGLAIADTLAAELSLS